MHMALSRGDLVTLDGRLAVVVGVEGDPDVPEEHVAIWYGGPNTAQSSGAGSGDAAPVVYTVPEEYCKRAPSPELRH